jgi:predicted PurR-regulated permease PerM
MKKWAVWGSIVGVCLFTYLTRGILLPFLTGLAVAYFLDPIADKLEERKVPRSIAAALVIGLFFFIIIGAVLAFWPILQGQLLAASKTLPEAVAKFRPWLDQILVSLTAKTGITLGGDAESLLAGFSEQALHQLNLLLNSIVRSGLAVFNMLTLALISPVVAFYLLRDWDHMVNKVNSWLPTDVAPVVREQMKNVDTVLAGFVRGQLMVSVIMGVMYGLGWSLVGLELGLVLGVLAGIMAFIPFVGALFAALIAVALAIGQWGFDSGHIGFVVLVFVVVQIIESSFLTPKLVGERVGLHPVWVLFAVFAGGEILGFVGVLVAVPAAAATAVFVRFTIKQYLDHYDLLPVEVIPNKSANDEVSNE